MTPKRILVVRLGAMGDIVHSLPAVANLKRGIGSGEVVWAIEEKWSPLLAGNPYVDRLEYVNRGSLRKILSLRTQLRSASFSAAVDFQGLLKSAMVAAFAAPDVIWGWHRSVAREWAASLLYSRCVIPESVHVVDRNLELAAAAGAACGEVSFPLPSGEAEGNLPSGDYVLANPLAGWVSKQWPLEYYAEVGRRLSAAGLSLVLNSSAPVRVPNTHVHVSGLSGLIHATRRALAVIGVDSGPMHLAAALGKPGVAIFGPTDPSRNGPYGGSFCVLRARNAVTSWKRRREIDSSMHAVTPDDVWAALRLQLPR